RDMFANLLQPGKVHNFILLVTLIVAYFAVYYSLFRWAILKFNIKTPGRGESGEEVKLYTKEDYNKERAPAALGSLEKNIIDALGGKENISEFTNCATRLRITVIDESKVADDELWTGQLEAIGVVRNNKYFQIIYGGNAITVASKVKDSLGIE